MIDFDFKNPDYTAVFKQRVDRLEALRSEPEKFDALKVYYRTHIADFINDWGMTFDPRNADIGLPTVIPFVLFDKQREYCDWVLEHWKDRKPGLGEKSRDMGLSWLSAGVAVALWLFHPGVVIGFGSRKEEYVDKLGSPKSLFWKIRMFIEMLPKEFTPHEYNAPFMRINNIDNGSYIVGEAGDEIGRGDRCSIYFVDESAFIERQQTVAAALSQTTNCQIDLSTPNGNGNLFYQKRHSGKIDVFTFHWKDDPRKDEAWYMKQKAELDDVILAQEVDIDYNASTADSWIPGDLVENAQSYGVADLEAVGSMIVSVDAAHMGDDESVIGARCGRIAYDQEVYKKLDGPALAGRVVEYCDNLLREPDIIIIELDGPGTSCYDQLRVPACKYRDKMVGVHTGRRLKDNKNYNLRAKMYRGYRDWLVDGPVRLPDDKELKSQSSAVKYKYRDGLLLLMSKEDMKSKGFKSPDRADQVALTWAADLNDLPASTKTRKPQQRAKNAYANNR
jgi:hypothetical protein